MERNLPATQDETPPDDASRRPVQPRKQQLSVAYLPLALVTFIILAFTIAAWTFLSTVL